MWPPLGHLFLGFLIRSIIEPETGILNYTIQEPAGIVGIIVPWNLPLYLLTFKLAPAIAYGNTVVAKPSELTSVTAFKLCQLLGQSGEWSRLLLWIKDYVDNPLLPGLPNGVINMVFGYGASVGEAIVKVRKQSKNVTFHFTFKM